MNFKELLQRAKDGDDYALSQILAMYKPLLLKESVINAAFDEDLFQELCVILLNCVRQFKI